MTYPVLHFGNDSLVLWQTTKSRPETTKSVITETPTSPLTSQDNMIKIESQTRMIFLHTTTPAPPFQLPSVTDEIVIHHESIDVKSNDTLPIAIARRLNETAANKTDDKDDERAATTDDGDTSATLRTTDQVEVRSSPSQYDPETKQTVPFYARTKEWERREWEKNQQTTGLSAGDITTWQQTTEGFTEEIGTASESVREVFSTTERPREGLHTTQEGDDDLETSELTTEQTFTDATLVEEDPQSLSDKEKSASRAPVTLSVATTISLPSETTANKSVPDDESNKTSSNDPSLLQAHQQPVLLGHKWNLF
ncbi:hypothetical protein C0Q70_05230 [Pomacea canaliculata]|uniref:Uncharacterized protein n=2 Tax=Pomacea canaliculata TaxID=400727 RepID=A0A2T7PKN0_POMCA|nr:hypothetical protein C0Q70_05230 [Pomacea canaliculata]